MGGGWREAELKEGWRRRGNEGMNEQGLIVP